MMYVGWSSDYDFIVVSAVGIFVDCSGMYVFHVCFD